MKINIIKSLENISEAKGIAVIIDVFRAFSTEAYIFHNGAKHIIPVDNLEEAYRLKKENPDYVLIGERGGIKPEGFDYGNSPTELLGVDFSDKIIVHTTSNGTKGLIGAVNADTIITGSFVNAGAIIRYIQEKKAEIVSLVSTSHMTHEDNEDIALGYYIRNELEGKVINQDDINKLVQDTSSYQYLFNEIGVPKTDFDLCLDFNRFDFIIKQEILNNQRILVKILV